MFITAFLLLYFSHRPKEKWANLDSNTFKVQLKALGKSSYEENVVFALFLLLAFLWISRSGVSFNGFTIPGWASIFNSPSFINDGTTAIFVSLLLFIWPSKNKKEEHIMNWKTANRLPWNIVLLFCGGFALAKGFESSGLALWFGEQLAWGDQIPSIVFVLAIVTMMSFLTELTSNVASTQMLLPAFAAIAVSTGDNPLLFMIPATIASSLAFMLPTATPSNAIIFGSDRINIENMIKAGFRLNMIGVIIITIMTYLLIEKVFGVVVNEIPTWAIK